MPPVASIALLAAHRAALTLGLRPAPDGWRRAAGLVLRGPESAFVLSALGLLAWSGGPATHSPPGAGATAAHARARLAAAFAAEPALRVRVRREGCLDRPEPAASACYRLRVERRPTGPLRFGPPSEWLGEPATPDACAGGALPVLDAVLRPGDDGTVDLWVRANHAGIDGAPLQEILSRVEADWGVDPALRYPAPDGCAALHAPRPIPGLPGETPPRAGVAEAQAFIDFGPLLAWRRRENARLGTPLSVAAAMMWHLGRHRSLRGGAVGSTVDVPARPRAARRVGVVTLRPAGYHGADGLARFARDFAARVDLARAGRDGGGRTLDASACLRPDRAAALLRHALAGDGAFGALGLTMLKDARVFGAPLADAGHPEGFLAVGGLALPGDGGPVGCVSIKGPAARVTAWPGTLREVIDRCGTS